MDGTDPSGNAVYFVERAFDSGAKKGSWYLNYGHGYLLFTSSSDPGTGDPFTTHQQILHTFSWHPNVWDYKDTRTPGRVWENHTSDTSPGNHSALLVTTSASQQATLLNWVNSWISAAAPGYELGSPVKDTVTPDPNNEIGSTKHVAAPKNGVYYSLKEQNCVWWATIMLKQSGITVPTSVYTSAADFNHGIGAASQVISGTRSAFDVRTLNGLPYGQFKLPGVQSLDASEFGAGLSGF